jgi:serine/threonine-protein kinase RsbW
MRGENCRYPLGVGGMSLAHGAGDLAESTRSVSPTEVVPDASARLDAVHETMERFWGRLGEAAAEDWKMLFELAVCEIAANIVEHARAEVMEFGIGLDGRRVVAEFIDTGRPYRRPSYPPQVSDDGDERGRGLVLARKVLDELSYHRTGSTNSWRLVKQL